MAAKTVGLTIDMNTIYKKPLGVQEKNGKDPPTRNGRGEPESRVTGLAKGQPSTRSPASISQHTKSLLTATGVSLPVASYALSPNSRTPKGRINQAGDSPSGRSALGAQGPGHRLTAEEQGPGARGLTEEAEANELADLEHQDLIYNLNCFNELNGIIESA
jgi:hypothetical protein